MGFQKLFTVPRLAVGTVSYTHLDVYKRQVQGSAAFQQNAVDLLLPQLFHQLQKIHMTAMRLDVYKRQTRITAGMAASFSASVLSTAPVASSMV